MKKIEKSKSLENVNYAIRGRILDAANKLEEKGFNILKLNIGNPADYNLNAPSNILESMKNNLITSQGYSDSKGLKSARKSIVEYYKNKNIDNIDIEDIYIGNGVNLYGGKAVHYRCEENNEWNPDIKDIERKITSKTKGIIIINPNNPTGAVYSKKVLNQIINIAKKNNLVIFSDEIYDRLIYDGVEHISIASLSKEIPIITFCGLSKSHMVAGFRIGWMCISGNKEYIKDYIDGLNLISSMRLCSNVPGQNIIPIALKNNSNMELLLKKGGRLYEQREFIYNSLKEISGITVVKPKAAFYIFPKIDVKKFAIEDDEKFALDFLKEKHVLFVNGKCFNWDKEDHFRLVYLADCDKLKYATESLRDFLENYNPKIS